MQSDQFFSFLLSLLRALSCISAVITYRSIKTETHQQKCGHGKDVKIPKNFLDFLLVIDPVLYFRCHIKKIDNEIE